MTINTETVAARLATRLAEHGVVLTDAAGFAAAFANDLVEWVGGAEAVPVALASKVTTTATAWNTDVMQRLDWWTGPADGGPNDDGLYPMTNAAGVTTLFPSLAKILDSTAKGNAGWTPKITSEADGVARRVLRVLDWTGGGGAKPAVGYIGAEGLVATPGEAVDFFGSVADDLNAIKVDTEAAQAASLGYRDQAQAYAAAANVDPLRESQGLFNKYPNLFSKLALDVAALGNTSGSAAVGTAIVDGRPCWTMTVAAGGVEQGLNFDFDIALFNGATVFSAAVRMMRIDAASGTRSARFMIQQFNGSSEITAARVVLTMASGVALTSQTVFEHKGVAIDPAATRIRYVLTAISADALVRVLSFVDMMMAGGPNASFRYPPVKISTDADAVAGLISDQSTPPTGVKAAINAQAANASNPNLYTDPELETVAVGALVAWGSTSMSVVSTQGAKRLRTPASASALSIIDASTRRIPVSSLPSGVFSASLVMTNKAETAAAADLRVRLMAFDADGNFLNASGTWSTVGNDDPAAAANRYTRYVPTAAVTKPTELVIAQNVPVPAAAVSIGFEIRVQTTVQMDFSHLTIRNGTDPHFVRQAVTSAGVSALQGQIDASATAVATLNAVAGETATTTAAQLANVFTAGEIDTTSDLRLVVSKPELSRSTFGELPCWVLTAPAGASAETSISMGPFKRSTLMPATLTKASAGLQFYSADAFSGTGVTRLVRVLIQQMDAAGAEITAARQTLNVTSGLLGLSAPAWARATGFDIDPSCDSFRIFVGISNNGGLADRIVKFGTPYLRAGSAGLFARPPVATIGDPVLHISPTGSDVTGLGTATSPLATLDAALDKLPTGNGTIVMLAGEYGAVRISPTKVRGRVLLTGQVSSYQRPIVRLAPKLTGITKTAGRTKIYQATVAGLPALASFQWAYQDGVADPRTLIAGADRSPQHKGRANRLPGFARLLKTAATTLSAALDEMDAASDPLAFVDSGVLYFTIVGGGDGAAANIYLDAQTGFISAGTRESCGDLIIQNLEIRYGGADMRPFRRAGLDNVAVMGSRTNCVDYAVLAYRDLEVACFGSQSDLNGDGLNGHGGAWLQGDDIYAHDGWDDGFSDHEGCTSRMRGGLVEYCGGAALIPAYGADHVSWSFVSRRNQRRANGVKRWKQGAFAVIGDPSSGSPADGGVDTRARFIGHVSIEDYVGFYDGSGTVDAYGDAKPSTASYAECIDCIAVDSVTVGYDVGPAVLRCDYGGAGTAKTARTTAKAVTRIT